MTMLLPVNFDVTTPLDYWRAGAAVPPPEAATRASRLQQLHDLGAGDLRSILPSTYAARGVPSGYFNIISNLRGRYLTVRPPTAAGIPDRQMRDAAFDGVRSLTQSGIAVLWSFGDEVEVVDARYYFPATDGAALVVPHAETWDVWTIRTSGAVLRTFVRSTSNPQTLGRLLSSTSFATGGRLVTCSVPPRTGEWGSSLYAEIVPHVAEVAFLQTVARDQVERAGKGVYAVATNDAAQGLDRLYASTLTSDADPNRPVVGNPRFAPQGRLPSAPAAALDGQYTDGYLTQRWRSRFDADPPLFVDFPIDAIDAPLGGVEAMLQLTRHHADQIAIASATPAAWLQAEGALSGPLSGEAIRRIDVVARVTLGSIWRELQECLADATGRAVVWPDPFADELQSEIEISRQ